MIDLHTHILPAMDDGAKTVEISLQMLHMEWAQGVETVALTPHFYGDLECIDSFLTRRQHAYDCLREAISHLPDEEQKKMPNLLLGAEVSWLPYMNQWKGLEKLCYENTNYLMLELPLIPWSGDVIHRLYELMNHTGITPVIAHIDRYWGHIDRRQMDELFSMGLPVQISAEAFLHLGTWKKALRLLQQGKAHMLISDAHGITDRPPNIGAAMNVIQRKDTDLCDMLKSVSLTEENG